VAAVAGAFLGVRARPRRTLNFWATPTGHVAAGSCERSLRVLRRRQSRGPARLPPPQLLPRTRAFPAQLNEALSTPGSGERGWHRSVFVAGMGHQDNSGFLLTNLAAPEMEQGDHWQAEGRFRQALALAERRSRPRWVALITNRSGRRFCGAGRPGLEGGSEGPGVLSSASAAGDPRCGNGRLPVQNAERAWIESGPSRASAGVDRATR
jgi:hypothetical protein